MIPEIATLTSRGEGVHRVTLQLNPRALGDVRVVLTMRHGDVHVRLAAGPEARAALGQSPPTSPAPWSDWVSGSTGSC